MPQPKPTPKDLVPAIGGPILALLDQALFGIGPMVQNILNAVNQTKALIEETKHFKFQPHWKTRVISLPAAEKGINDLWQTITVELRSKIQEVTDSVQALKDLLAQPPVLGGGRVSQALEKLNIVREFIQLFGNSVAKFVNLEATIQAIEQRIESLDDLFLPQSNPRKVETATKKFRVAP